jgi:hypothetical protein
MQPSNNFAGKLVKITGEERVKLELIQGTEHGEPRFEKPDNVIKVLDFLDAYLK